MLDIEARGIILSKQRPAPLLFAYGINKFSHVMAHLYFVLINCSGYFRLKVCVCIRV